MSVVNTSIVRQPLKFVEIPLNKFKDEVIPHHISTYENHKILIQKLVSANNIDQLSKEIKGKKRTVRQLRDLMYELDTLRAQVEDPDLDIFDTKTLSLRKDILKLTSGYAEIEKSVTPLITPKQEDEEISNKENCNPFEGASQIQLHEDINELRLKQMNHTLNKVEDIHKDVEDLHEMYQDLHHMVGAQAESVTQVEENVESAHENVQEGARQISKAHRLKAVAYPVTGAFLGGILGGPIGLVAGLKVGGVAALGCAIAGYTGGKYFKKINDPETIDSEASASISVVENQPTETEKKDI